MFWTLVTFVIVLVHPEALRVGPIQAVIDARRTQIRPTSTPPRSAQGGPGRHSPSTATPGRVRTRRPRSSTTPPHFGGQRERDLAELEAEKTRQVERAQAEIAAETRRSLQAIRDQLADLTVAAAEKVVRKQLDEGEQRRLIEEALRRRRPSSVRRAGRRRRGWMAELIDAGARVYADGDVRGGGRGRPRRAGRPRHARSSPRWPGSGRLLQTLLNPQLPHDAKQRIVHALLSEAEPWRATG